MYIAGIAGHRVSCVCCKARATRRPLVCLEGSASVSMEPAKDISMLKRAIKMAEKQTGSVRKSMVSAGFYITGRNSTALIRGCRKGGQWEKALEILEVVRSKGAFAGEGPSFYTFSAAVSVCSKSERLDEALWVLNEMKHAAMDNPLLKPDEAVYRLITLCSARLHKYSVTVEMLSEMKQRGFQAEKETLMEVLSIMVRGRCWRYATWVLNELHSCDIVLSAQTYSDFIGCAVEAGKIGIATEVFLMMQMVGVNPDPYSCHYMVQAAVASGNHVNGKELLEDASEMGIPVLKDTYQCLMKNVTKSCARISGTKSFEVKENSLFGEGRALKV